MTKTQEALKLLNDGKIKESLKIFKTFKIGFSVEEKKQIARASEMLNGYSLFYFQLGYKLEDEVNKALKIIRRNYEIKETSFR